MSLPSRRLAHGLRPMNGRDPDERHRVATPLELLFDLTFVVAFANAGNEMAHQVAAGHIFSGVGGFAFAQPGRRPRVCRHARRHADPVVARPDSARAGAAPASRMPCPSPSRSSAGWSPPSSTLSLITFALIAGVLIAVECVGPYLAERHGGPSAAVCTSQPVAETAAPRPCWRMKCAATSTRPRLSRGKATSTAKTQRAGQCTAGGVKESRRASSRAMAAVNSP